MGREKPLKERHPISSVPQGDTLGKRFHSNETVIQRVNKSIVCPLCSSEYCAQALVAVIILLALTACQSKFSQQ